MSIYQNQKITKPNIEDEAGDFLNTEKTAALLNLVEFIRTNKINIQWGSGNSWALNYKGKRLGYLKIYTGIKNKPPGLPNVSWYFCHNRAYLERYYSMGDCDLKTFIFEHIFARNCGNCICSNANPDERKAGYMNPTGCGCWPLRIYDPEREALERTKQLIELRKNFIMEDN